MIKTSPGYELNRARISVALSRFTVPLLSQTYRAFDGDVAAAIVLGEIAHRNVEAWLAQQHNPEELLHDPAQRERIMRPCNALSVSRTCGLPRETVRRKVVLLIERGYIYRADDGSLYLTRTVGDDFTEMNATLLENLLSAAREIEGLLKPKHSPSTSG